MEKRKRLVKPQSTETLENVDVYACENNIGCVTNGESGCGGTECPCVNVYVCGVTCFSETNLYSCGSGGSI